MWLGEGMKCPSDEWGGHRVKIQEESGCLGQRVQFEGRDKLHWSEECMARRLPCCW